MTFIWKIILAMLIFSVVVLFHELGHFLLAKKNKIKVIEFSLGMGPRLWSTVKGETRYSLKLLPFGGACAMAGEDDDDNSAGSFQNASVWGRISVVAAGPVFNFIMALVGAMIIVAVGGVDKPVVAYVAEGSAEESAGLQVGDQITEFEGRNIYLGKDIDTYIALRGLEDSEISLSYIRDGEEYDLTYSADSETKYMLGFSYDPTGSAEVLSLTQGLPLQKAGMQVGSVITSIDGVAIADGAALQTYTEEHPWSDVSVNVGYEYEGVPYEITVRPVIYENIQTKFYTNLYREEVNALGVVKYGVAEMRYWIVTTLDSLQMLVKGRFGVSDLSGPVGIVDSISDTYDVAKEEGATSVWLTMINWIILLSANLGVMNLLPLPALDGGRLVFLIIEAIRGKKVNPNVEGMIHFAGLMALMALMVFIMYQDIQKAIF